MELWKKISLMLCVFGVLKEFRPSEPYVTKILIREPMNFTLDQVSNDIYPVSIYSTMASLVVVFLITDLLRYKPVIIFDGVCAVIVFLLLLTARSLILVQVLEVFYGLFMAAEVAYYTYIYAKVDRKHYQEVSGHTRAAYLVGRAVSGIVGQAYVLWDHDSYYNLNYFSLAGMTLATIWACFLPPVTSSLYFNGIRGILDPEPVSVSATDDSFIKELKSKCKKSIGYLKDDFICAMCNIYIVKWMLWWSLATCGYLQVLSYVQILWEQIILEAETTKYSEWNGAVEAVYTLLSAATAYGSGLLTIEWKSFGELVLFLCSIVIALLIILMCQTMHLWIAYATYVLYTIFFNGMITIANSEIAKNLNPDSHGLIFGFTTFLALVFQSILTYSVSSMEDERSKFLVYGCYFVVLGLIFGVITIVKSIRWCVKRWRAKQLKHDNVSSDSF